MTDEAALQQFITTIDVIINRINSRDLSKEDIFTAFGPTPLVITAMKWLVHGTNPKPIQAGEWNEPIEQIKRPEAVPAQKQNTLQQDQEAIQKITEAEQRRITDRASRKNEPHVGNKIMEDSESE